MISGRTALFFAAAALASAVGCRGDNDGGSAATSAATPPYPPDVPRSSASASSRSGALPEGIVARVGSIDIAGTSVARIAAAQGIDLKSARAVAIRDALFASEARARGLDERPEARSLIDAALARLVLRDLFAAAKRAGEVTDSELYDATQFRWLDLDRPPGFRTVHAVVRLDAKADAARRKDALALAESIRRALEPISRSPSPAPMEPAPAPASEGVPSRDAPVDPLIDAFKQAAGAVEHDGFEVIIEPLPPVAADGRVIEPGGRAFDPEFARAAAALIRRGDLSPPIVSLFGVHIIMLLERTPPLTFPPDERRERVRDDVIAARARASGRDLLDRARQGVAVDRSVDALLALVPIDQEGQ